MNLCSCHILLAIILGDSKARFLGYFEVTDQLEAPAVG